MNRRGFLLALAGAAAGGAVFTAQAQAAPAASLWDELQDLEGGGDDLAGDMPAEGAAEAQGRRGGNYRGGRAVAGRHYGRPRGRAYYRRGYYPRGRAYGYYYGPRYRRYRRRVCRRVVNRYGYVVRRCWWVR